MIVSSSGGAHRRTAERRRCSRAQSSDASGPPSKCIFPLQCREFCRTLHTRGQSSQRRRRKMQRKRPSLAPKVRCTDALYSSQTQLQLVSRSSVVVGERIVCRPGRQTRYVCTRVPGDCESCGEPTALGAACTPPSAPRRSRRGAPRRWTAQGLGRTCGGRTRWRVRRACSEQLHHLAAVLERPQAASGVPPPAEEPHLHPTPSTQRQ